MPDAAQAGPLDIANRAFDERLTSNAVLKRTQEYQARGELLHHFEQLPAGTDETVIGGRRLIQLGSSNYLGLSQDPRVKAAAADALERFGTSCTSSRMLSGSRPVHHELERQLARFLGKEAALLFPTGYLAAIGAIAALVGRRDAALSDDAAHASLIDGIRLSGARHCHFRHSDMAGLEASLATLDAPRKLIVTASISSLSVALAPLDAIVELARRHGAWVLLDDTDGFGVLGPEGRGLAHARSLEDAIPVIMGVLSKSLASSGGFIAGSAKLIEHLRYNARPYVFSSAIAPAQAEAALAALRILQTESDRPARARAHANEARTRLRAMGYRCGGDGTHLVPVLLGDDHLAFTVAEALARHGVWVSPEVSPAVPPGSARLQCCLPPTMTTLQRDRAYAAFEAVAADYRERL